MDPAEGAGFFLGFVALLIPVMIVGIVFRYKLKVLQVGQKSPALPPADATTQRRLEAVASEKKLLEERVRNLESIVCSVDLELNARLMQVAQSGGGAPHKLPAAGAPRPQATPMAAGPSILPGQVLVSRYHIERELGRGG